MYAYIHTCIQLNLPYPGSVGPSISKTEISVTWKYSTHKYCSYNFKSSVSEFSAGRLGLQEVSDETNDCMYINSQISFMNF